MATWLVEKCRFYAKMKKVNEAKAVMKFVD